MIFRIGLLLALFAASAAFALAASTPAQAKFTPAKPTNMSMVATRVASTCSAKRLKACKDMCASKSMACDNHCKACYGQY
jgi:hypothetical protein